MATGCLVFGSLVAGGVCSGLLGDRGGGGVCLWGKLAGISRNYLLSGSLMVCGDSVGNSFEVLSYKVFFFFLVCGVLP